jgi:hypothetical protein
MAIQFEIVRKDFDPIYTKLHDELTDCYRNGKPYKQFGVLSKEKYEALHARLWHRYNVGFHNANMNLPEADRIPESKYRYEYDDAGNIVADKVEQSRAAAEAIKFGEL